MNAPLRDFLNCKEDGTENYTFKEVRESNEWIEFPTEKAACHQNFYQECIFKNGVKIPKYNAKFVDTKGREVVFNAKHEIILSYPDKGTFNYQNPDKSLLSKDFSHYTSDKVVPPRIGWTIKEMTDTGKGNHDRFGYSNFKDLPLGK